MLTARVLTRKPSIAPRSDRVRRRGRGDPATGTSALAGAGPLMGVVPMPTRPRRAGAPPRPRCRRSRSTQHGHGSPTTPVPSDRPAADPQLLTPGALLPFGLGGWPLSVPRPMAVAALRRRSAGHQTTRDRSRLAEPAKGVYDGKGTDKLRCSLMARARRHWGSTPGRSRWPRLRREHLLGRKRRLRAGLRGHKPVTGRPTPNRAWATSARSTSRPSLSPSTSPAPSAARTWFSCTHSRRSREHGFRPTDAPAVTFNAAGVHPNTVLAAASLGHHDADRLAGHL